MAIAAKVVCSQLALSIILLLDIYHTEQNNN